ncbi:MAG: substrate-binding domain-containing protein [Sphingomicrobium sp.]
MKRLSALAALSLLGTPASARELKVCADPNNLPFSNAKGEGFENRIIQMIAEELNADLTYVWWAQRRGNVRETLNAGLCDLIPGAASSLEMVATTRPYYRSSYVALVREGPLTGINSLDDPRLGRLRVGVQLIGDDGSNTPPAHALARRGIVENVQGFPIYGDYAEPTPQSAIVDAVAAGTLDVAFVWGPTAGYFAKREPVKLILTPVTPKADGPALPMVFDVSMGVRRADLALKREVEAALKKRAAEVRAILIRYGVPLVE